MASETTKQDHGSEVRPPGHRRRGMLWSTVGLVGVVAAGAGYWFLAGDTDTEAAEESAGPVATAEVARETISATRTWGGTLGHGEPITVMAAGQGTLTRMAEQDTEVERGTELYRVDEQPVAALIGAIPMYRDLAPGNSGVDVKQLEANLDELGYDGFTVDNEYTWATSLAVQEWQDDVGAAETGSVAQTDVVFVPESGNVAAAHAAVGDAVTPDSPVLDIVGPDPLVSMEVDAFDRELVEIDAEVTVQLPGDEQVDGTVSSARAVPAGDADGESGDSGDDNSTEDTVIEVEVALSEEVDESLLGASVDVVVDVDEREDVLVVPVNALLALGQGGYGLEVVADDGTTSIVTVETGLFEGGNVEVSGDGIDEGTVVGVAGR